MVADCFIGGPEDLARKFSIHNGHDRSLVFIVHGEGTASQKRRSSSTEIVGRDLKILGIGRRVGRTEIGGGVSVYVGISSADTERKPIGISHGGDARDRCGNIEHALLHLYALVGRHIPPSSDRSLPASRS